jgi:hypothetical protein
LRYADVVQNLPGVVGGDVRPLDEDGRLPFPL